MVKHKCNRGWRNLRRDENSRLESNLLAKPYFLEAYPIFEKACLEYHGQRPPGRFEELCRNKKEMINMKILLILIFKSILNFQTILIYNNCLA